MELVSLLAGIALGASVISIFIILRSTLNNERSLTTSSSNISSTVKYDELDSAKKRLKTLLLEKDLLSSSLTQVYQAEAEGRINKNDRDNLSSKYNDQLKLLEGKLGDVEVLIEVGELERVRTEMIDLLERKIENVDSRLSQARIKFSSLNSNDSLIEDSLIEDSLIEDSLIEDSPVGTSDVISKPESSKEISTKIEPKPKKTEKNKTKDDDTDVEVKKIKNEVIEALTKLEQMDMDS
jgi:hypothetical protein